MKKIGIIGSRRRDTEKDYQMVLNKFKELYQEGDIIISGGCYKGGDRFAEKIAKENTTPITIYYANWNKYGKGAGFLRNTDIARESDILIACVSQDRIGGTEDTIRKFLKSRDKQYLYLV